MKELLKDRHFVLGDRKNMIFSLFREAKTEFFEKNYSINLVKVIPTL